MRGLNCSRCKNGGPYITAYEIALKHGFVGTEEDWINTIGCIYLARVTARGSTDWDCSDTYEELLEQMETREVHLVTLDGRIAFLNGGTDEMMTFCTPTYNTAAGTVYDKYELGKTTPGDAMTVNVSSETGTITLDRLASGIQTSLGKADSAYQKPGTGIPSTDLSSSAQAALQAAPIIYATVTKSGSVYSCDWSNTDLHGYASPIAALEAGADLRMMYSPSGVGSPVVSHPCIGTVNNGSAILFGGVEEYTDFDSYTWKIAFYAIDSDGNVDYIEKPILETIDTTSLLQYFTITVTESSGTYTSDKTFAQISDAFAANKILRFYYKTFLGSLVEVGENAAIFYAFDMTIPSTPKLYTFTISGTGTSAALVS